MRNRMIEFIGWIAGAIDRGPNEFLTLDGLADFERIRVLVWSTGRLADFGRLVHEIAGNIGRDVIRSGRDNEHGGIGIVGDSGYDVAILSQGHPYLPLGTDIQVELLGVAVGTEILAQGDCACLGLGTDGLRWGQEHKHDDQKDESARHHLS